MRLAHTHPTGGLGFADAVWWSRLAQPEQHRWLAESTLPRWSPRACAQEEAAPKALAWDGLLVRYAPQPGVNAALRKGS